MERILITGMGRSGSKWLTRTLADDAGGQKTCVVHERLSLMDYQATHLLRAGDYGAAAAIVAQREDPPEVRAGGCDRYVEVAPCARYLAGLIKKQHPETRVLHLVRDGKLVVRSMMARPHYKGGPNQPPGQVEAPRHLKTRFAKCCWLWADTVRMLAKHPMVRLDAIQTAARAGELARALGFPDDEVARVVAQFDPAVVDATHYFSIEPADLWCDEHRDLFSLLCGPYYAAMGFGESEGPVC